MPPVPSALWQAMHLTAKIALPAAAVPLAGPALAANAARAPSRAIEVRVMARGSRVRRGMRVAPFGGRWGGLEVVARPRARATLSGGTAPVKPRAPRPPSRSRRDGGSLTVLATAC